MKIAGTGNLTFVQAPKLTLPTSFEQYNVKTTESINASASGISGYRQFEYPFIARAEGTYEVEPVEFTYFDPDRMQYTTLQTKPLTLDVTPDASGGSAASKLNRPTAPLKLAGAPAGSGLTATVTRWLCTLRGTL